MGLGSDFFDAFKGALKYVLDLMQSTIIFNAYGYRVSLWDLHTVSTTLIHFFNAIIVPLVGVVPGIDDYAQQEEEEKQMEDYLSVVNRFKDDDEG